MLVPMALSLFGFLGYWWAHYSPATQAWFDARWSGDDGKVKRVFSLKLWGFITMGVIPAVVLHSTLGWSLADLGMKWPAPASMELWLWWAALLGSTMVLSMVAGKEGAKNYPQIRAKEWSLSTMVWSGAGWTLYLSAYEFMFRGFLIFPPGQRPWHVACRGHQHHVVLRDAFPQGKGGNAVVLACRGDDVLDDRGNGEPVPHNRGTHFGVLVQHGLPCPT